MNEKNIIKVSDFDVADVNIEVAKQFLMKARCVSGEERKLKSLMFARRSIDNAIESFGVEVQNIKFEKSSSPENLRSQTNQNKTK